MSVFVFSRSCADKWNVLCHIKYAHEEMKCKSTYADHSSEVASKVSEFRCYIKYSVESFVSPFYNFSHFLCLPECSDIPASY
jgi:hypothetical protein